MHTNNFQKYFIVISVFRKDYKKISNDGKDFLFLLFQTFFTLALI